jgi:hypothetical protein
MPPLTPGVELTGRYQLHRQLSDDGLIETWTATDQVLARAVEVEILRPDTGTNERNAFLASASAVARLSHPGIVNAYDTGLSADGMPFLVLERSLGPTLAELVIRQGPLAPSRVVVIGVQIAQALDVAHRNGVVHGAVSPPTVQVADDDRAKISGFTASGMRTRLSGVTPDPTDDVDAWARSLVAALLGASSVDAAATDPPGVGTEVPARARPPGAGPARAGRAGAAAAVSARALRPGIPPSLDAVLVGAQRGGPITSAADLAAQLGRLELTDDARPALDGQPTPPLGTRGIPPPVRFDGGRAGAIAGVVVGLLLAIAVAVAAFVLFGRGGTPSPSGGGGPAQTTVLPAPKGVPLAIVAAHSFDPFGNLTEREDVVNNLRDGNPATLWSTEEYKTAHFGGLKPGVGVVLLLDSSHPVGQLTVDSPSRDWAFAVYVAATPSAALDGWGPPVVSDVRVTDQSTTVDLKGRVGAAVLVWITDLGPPLAHPPDPGIPYRVDIGEVQVH